jgi:hypothetical protein
MIQIIVTCPRCRRRYQLTVRSKSGTWKHVCVGGVVVPIPLCGC